MIEICAEQSLGKVAQIKSIFGHAKARAIYERIWLI